MLQGPAVRHRLPYRPLLPRRRLFHRYRQGPIRGKSTPKSLTALLLSCPPPPVRPVQAFVIYCFFQLLVSYLGGERSLLILLHGRQPIPHPFPFNIFLKPMDISDPWVLLNLKRGILRESAGCGRERGGARDRSSADITIVPRSQNTSRSNRSSSWPPSSSKSPTLIEKETLLSIPGIPMSASCTMVVSA